MEDSPYAHNAASGVSSVSKVPYLVMDQQTKPLVTTQFTHPLDPCGIEVNATGGDVCVRPSAPLREGVPRKLNITRSPTREVPRDPLPTAYRAFEFPQILYVGDGLTGAGPFGLVSIGRGSEQGDHDNRDNCGRS